MRVLPIHDAPIQIRFELGDWRAKELTNTVIVSDIGQHKGTVAIPWYSEAISRYCHYHREGGWRMTEAGMAFSALAAGFTMVRMSFRVGTVHIASCRKMYRYFHKLTQAGGKCIHQQQRNEWKKFTHFVLNKDNNGGACPQVGTRSTSGKRSHL